MAVLRVLAVLLLAAGFASNARAQAPADIAPAEQAAIRGVIERQLEAFQRDDGASAFGFASPMIQSMFGSSENFMAMVRRGYPQVYRPRSVAFDRLLDSDGTLIQLVDLVGPDGAPVVAAYEMQRQDDGSWRINGCVLLRSPARAT